MSINVTEASDADLMACFAAGRDQRAFAQLVARHGPMVMGVARGILHDRHDAEEAFQATFLALAAAAGKLRDKAAVGAWLHQTAVRSARSTQRMNARWTRNVEEKSRETQEAYVHDRHQELRETIDVELARLPKKLRAAVVLCDLEGLTCAIAAERLGLSASTLANQVAEGRKLLKSRLAKRGVGLSVAALTANLAEFSAATPVLSSTMIATTTTKASLFAAGHSAAEIGVSTITFQIARGVLREMTTTKLTMICAAALAIVFLAGAIGDISGVWDSTVKAETIFFDDFEDGDATDGSPASWKPAPFFDTGGYEVVDGDFTLTSLPGPAWPNTVKVAYADITPIGDTSVRAQFREVQGSDPIALLARFDPIAITAYQAGIGSSEIYIARNDGLGVPPILASSATSLHASQQDVILQFDVIGNQLSLYAWAAGEQMPTTPVLIVTDDHYTRGVLGVLMDGTPPRAAAFRYVQVANAPIPIPEPSTATLAGVIVFTGIFAWKRRRSR